MTFRVPPVTKALPPKVPLVIFTIPAYSIRVPLSLPTTVSAPFETLVEPETLPAERMLMFAVEAFVVRVRLPPMVPLKLEVTFPSIVTSLPTLALATMVPPVCVTVPPKLSLASRYPPDTLKLPD